MQLRNFLSVLEAFGGISTPVLQPSRLNDTGSSDGLHAECATYATLLCYPNICDTSEFADPTINIFVKRFLAPNVTPSSQQIYGLFKEYILTQPLFLMTVEIDMLELHPILKGELTCTRWTMAELDGALD
ncbi:hypothetical protein L914_15953 [Phytophthora nicotianae]|uniref:Uncharacterized protein n=1 Tax=Phytophthora nicotianae TaxID=4792 RepID=W2MMB6_PHYNI|nr:hypothetical protein L914_15953 [Phytophthora nicotianae]